MCFSLFKKKKVHFLGRSGLIFEYNRSFYFIDSEMSFDRDVDIVIFGDSVQLKDERVGISEALKKAVLEVLVDYLTTEEHLKVKIK